jgi:hypothetical protein
MKGHISLPLWFKVAVPTEIMLYREYEFVIFEQVLKITKAFYTIG